jgi:hypothetical protein
MHIPFGEECNVVVGDNSVALIVLKARERLALIGDPNHNTQTIAGTVLF